MSKFPGPACKLLLVLCQLCVVPSLNAADSSLESDIDAIMQDWHGEVPGAAVAYIDAGQMVFAKAYGLANLEHGIPWRTDTVSDLGSVSKQFTGFAHALLVERERLTLDDDIRLHIPQLPDFGPTITIKHLFHHSSGLREIYNTLSLINWKPGDGIFQEDAQTLVQSQARLQFEPGTQYLYNNTEYMLLADIVEATTGAEFHAWMTDNLFLPLGMSDSYVMHRQGQVMPRGAASYARDDDGHFNQVYDNSTVQGAGGIYSTVEDLSRWVINFSQLEVGSARTLERLVESGSLADGESLNYGLGIAVDEVGGVETWSHGGSSAGYRSHLLYLPAYERGFVMLTNTPSHGSPVAALTERFLGDVLETSAEEGAQPDAAEPAAQSGADGSVYTGKYFSEELEVFYNVINQGGDLRLAHRWQGGEGLSYRGEDVFELEDGGSVTFRRGRDGSVQGFELENGRTIGVRFERAD